MPSLIRYCDSPRCGEELPSDSAKSRRYCDATCRSAARYWRDKQRRAAPPDDRGELVREQRNWKPNKAINTITADVRDNLETYARRGGVYRRLRDAPEILDALIAGDPEMTLTVAGEMLGVSSTAIRRALAAIMADLDTEEAADAWNMDVDYERMLGRDDGIDLDELTDLFVEWRDTFMTDEKGEPYITKDFHRKWIRAILGAIRGGERKMILSPPRHGKTQLLIDFCTWQIVRNPNVRIVWIASIEDLAKDWLAAIQDQLDNNEKLRAAYLRPGEDFKPAHRSGKTWSRSQFTVATRTVTGIKSPTMQSVGRSGRILSRDVDFMIVDDIEDHGSTVQPANRESTRKWFAQDSGSRKEEHTAVIVIGSRQHPDDLYGHLLTNPEWESIVEEAHQGTCPLPKQPEEAHVECMLFPEKRSYSWFLAQQRSFAITGGDALFQMVYQNVPVAEGLVIFDVEEMVACRDNRDRGEVPAGSRLVAGLDPATAGYQAAVLWAYTASTGQIHLVDVSNQAGAGIGGWRDILREWWDVYGLTHWVVETNAAQSGYLDDTWVRDFRTRYSIHIEPHQTGSNKWDPHIGLTAMARMFGETYEHPDPTTGIDRTLRRITLPYGTPNAKAVTDLYIGQARHFSQNASASKSARKGYKSDVLMASWFPMRSIRRWKSEDAAEMDVEYEQSFSSFQQTEWNEVPWR